MYNLRGMNRGNGLGTTMAGVLAACAVVVPVAVVAAVGTVTSSLKVDWMQPTVVKAAPRPAETLPKPVPSAPVLAAATKEEATPEIASQAKSASQTRAHRALPKPAPPASLALSGAKRAQQASASIKPTPPPSEPPVRAEVSTPATEKTAFEPVTPTEFPHVPGPESPHLLPPSPGPTPARLGTLLANQPVSLRKSTGNTGSAAPVSVSLARNAPMWSATFNYAQIWNGDPSQKLVSLTFDDGPHPTFTPKLLALLEEQDITASFFFIGRNVECCPDLARQTAAAGHDVLNHTFNHIRLADAPESVVRRELSQGMKAIEEATGFAPRVFRTPGGGYSTTVLRVAKEMDMTMAQWSANAYDGTRTDSTNPSADEVYRAVMQQVRSGSIVLLHEPSEGSLDALPRIIRELRARGYRFVPLTEMMRQQAANRTSFEAAMARGNFSPRDYVLR